MPAGFGFQSLLTKAADANFELGVDGKEGLSSLEMLGYLKASKNQFAPNWYN